MIIVWCVLFCTVVLGRGMVGNYFCSWPIVDSSTTRQVYRDTSGTLQTRDIAGQDTGVGVLTEIRFLSTTTAKMQEKPGCASVLVYRALWRVDRDDDAKSVLVTYKPPDGILITFNDPDALSTAEIWTRFPAAPNKN